MATKKWEIITSGIMITTLVILFIVDATNQLDSNQEEDYSITRSNSYYPDEYPGPFQFIFTLICILILFPIFYIYIKRVWTHKWKRLIAAIFFAAIIVILTMQFIFRPLQWGIVLSILLEIEIVGMVVFDMLNIMQDVSNKILVAIFPTVIISHFTPFVVDPYNDIISIFLLGGAYFVMLRLYVKHILTRWWKAVTIITILVFIFCSVIVILLILYFHILHGLSTWFYILITVDGSLALVLWLWIHVPKVKAWLKSYIDKEILHYDQYNFLEMAGLPTRFTVLELNIATENFETPIGIGGSGAVFKGVMGDGSIVAVKRIKGQLASGEQEFRTEITIIASLQHVNLVRLLGYCLSPRGDRYLIYPFFENGSLDSWLFAEEEKRSHLTWVMRYNIAIAVAKALAYLHYECHHRILHLDVKPANILLDGDFKALLADFGISKSIGRDESSVVTKGRGTPGYYPPEMLVLNTISAKCDVYSYGMVLMELVGGRKNFLSTMNQETQHITNTYFPKIAREKMIQGKLMEVVDQSLIKHQAIREDQVIVIVQVALWCIQQKPELRPTMAEVVDMLEGRATVQMPPESPMLVLNFLDCSTSEGHALNEENVQFSVNTISISIQSGR